MTRSGDELTDRGRCKTTNAAPMKLRNSRSALLYFLSPVRLLGEIAIRLAPAEDLPGKLTAAAVSLLARAPRGPSDSDDDGVGDVASRARARVASTAAAAWLLRQISPSLSLALLQTARGRERESAATQTDRVGPTRARWPSLPACPSDGEPLFLTSIPWSDCNYLTTHLTLRKNTSNPDTVMGERMAWRVV